MRDDPLHALSFGAAAADYERGRPSYPDDAVDWLVDRVAELLGRRVHDVADVGAGTGKFTASLAARGLAVTAVEPDPQMRSRLDVALPAVVSLPGSAESLPLADGAVDLVTFAQAWHWVRPVDASPEVARVLRPGGALALVWNIRDESIDWVARLGEVMGSSAAELYEYRSPAVAPALTRVDYRAFGWTATIDRETLLAMVTSRSYVIVLDEDARADLVAGVEHLLDTHPDLAGRTVYELPYLTHVTIATAAD